MKVNKLVIALFLSAADSGSATQQSMIATLQQQQLESRYKSEHQFAQTSASGGQQGYAHFKKYSPFYLRSHPQERAQGDIADIQMLSMQTGQNQLEGVENVFEKNFGSFEKLVTGAATSSQKQPKVNSQKQVPQPQPQQEVQERTFAQLDQAAIADQSQGGGLFLEESAGQSEGADSIHQEERKSTRPPPLPVRKAMMKTFHAKSISPVMPVGTTETATTAVPQQQQQQQASTAFGQVSQSQVIGQNMIPMSLPQVQPAQIIYAQPAQQPSYFMAAQPMAPGNLARMVPVQQAVQMQEPQLLQPQPSVQQQQQQPQQDNKQQKELMEKIQQIEQKVGSVKEKIESLEKQKKELDASSQMKDSARVQINADSEDPMGGRMSQMDITMLQVDEDVVEGEESSKHQKKKKKSKKHKKKKKHHKKAKKEDPEATSDATVDGTYHKELGPKSQGTSDEAAGEESGASVTIQAQKKAKQHKSKKAHADTQSEGQKEAPTAAKSSDQEKAEAEPKDKKEKAGKAAETEKATPAPAQAPAPKKVSQDQQMEDEMDIGEDLVAADDQAKPFDVGLQQSESLSELEEIGFADSAALEAEAVDMDPEERQQRDLLQKQKQEEQTKRQELQQKVDEQKQKLQEAQHQLDEQVQKQKELEKQSKEQVKSHKRSLAQLAAKAKKRSMMQQYEEEKKFEQDMF